MLACARLSVTLWPRIKSGSRATQWKSLHSRMAANRISGPLSHVSCYIELEIRIDDKPVAVAIASGFLWLYDGDTYLITNLHNLAGWDFARGKALSENGAVPSYVRIA